MRGLNAVEAEDYLVPKTPLGWVYRILSIAGMVSGAYHGYKRNDSIGWAIGWGLLGGAFPFITIPVSLAQGYGKARKANRRNRRQRNGFQLGSHVRVKQRLPAWSSSSAAASLRGLTGVVTKVEKRPHGDFAIVVFGEDPSEQQLGFWLAMEELEPFTPRRRNAKLRPGQKWRRYSGEAWKACSECAEPIGPFDSIAQAEAHDSQCRRCSSLETATTGTFKAVKRRNRRRPRVMNRRVRGPYFYYARGFTLGRQGAPLAGLESMTGVERRAAQDGYVAGEMAMTAQVVTEAAGRRIRNRGRGRVPNGGSRRRNGPSKARVIAAVNEAGRLSRRGGAPMLSTGSSREVILRWLQWNDPNGVYVDSCAEFRNGDMDLIDEDLAWELLTQAVEEDL